MEYGIVKNGLVYIVIINWNGWRDTMQCIDSLRKLTYPLYRVVVIDNGSTDESVSKLQACVPYIDLIKTGKNLGFSGGNNVGIRWAIEQKASYVLLLNNDTVVAPDLLDAFVKVADTHPDVAAMAPKIYYFDQPDLLWFAGGKAHNRLDSPDHLGGGEKDKGQYDQVCDTPFINGCAFFARTKTIADIGLLDERYFYMFEDTDWTMRFLQAGYRCLYVPQARLWHKAHGATGGERTPCWCYFYERNRLLWLKTHFSKIGLGTVLRSVLISVAREIGIPINMRRPHIRLGRCWRGCLNGIAMLIGVVDYLRGYCGECPPYVRCLGRGFLSRNKKINIF